MRIKNFLTKNISIKENKNFKLASGINPQDKNYKSLMKNIIRKMI